MNEAVLQRKISMLPGRLHKCPGLLYLAPLPASFSVPRTRACGFDGHGIKV